jgi:hypothetical protein
LLAALNNWIVPSDWRQWEESHRRRREAEKAAPRVKPMVKDAASDATVRFNRAEAVAAATTPSAIAAVADATPVSVAAMPAEDDEAPSWAAVPEPPSRRLMWSVVGVAAFLVAGGGIAVYAKNTGLFGQRVVVAEQVADAGTIELPVVSPVTSNSAGQAGTLVHDSLQRDSVRADSQRRVAADRARHLVDSVRADSCRDTRAGAAGAGSDRAQAGC